MNAPLLMSGVSQLPLIHHFVSCSGGKDSTAVMCLAMERMQRRADFRPRFQFCGVENENDVTLEHIAYLERQLGITIERLSAYDVPGLIDAAAFERKRQVIRDNWPKELRRTRHTTDCAARREAIPALAPGCRHSPERKAALLAWVAACDCPVIVSPPVPQDRIEQAVAALQPSGNAFLDMCLMHGRFPSKKAKFCTEELKMMPLNATRQPIWDAGGTTVDWVGERAQESKDRAAKAVWRRIRMPGGGTKIIWLPIHHWDARETFAIAKRHGLKPNPLYLWGAGRVGCWPCINARKNEIGIIARRSPEKIAEMREWERRVSLVSRRDQGGDGMFATFFSADKVPGDPDDWNRARIDNVVEWARTTRGGNQFDLLAAIMDAESDDEVVACVSEYGLCE